MKIVNLMYFDVHYFDVRIYNNTADLASLNNTDIGSWFVINASIVHVNDQ